MIHPVEGRYGRADVKAVFEEENKLQRMLDVEAALARAHAAVGNIPKKDANAISKRADTKYVKVARVKAIEREINHDVMACHVASHTCGEHENVDPDGLGS